MNNILFLQYNILMFLLLANLCSYLMFFFLLLIVTYYSKYMESFGIPNDKFYGTKNWKLLK